MAYRRSFSSSQPSPSSHMAMRNGGSKKDLCLKCKKVVGDGEKGVCCQKCHSWFHSQCLNLTAAEYRVVQKNENLMWFCNECKQSVDDLLGQLSSKLEKTDKSIESLSDKMDKLLEKIDEKCSRTVVRDIVDEVVEQKIERKIEEYMNERVDREKRRKNLMLFNVPESQSDVVENRMDFDQGQAETVLGKLSKDGEDDVVVRYPRRIGERGEKVRPLRVTLESNEQLGKILKRGKDLKTVEVNEEEVFIADVVISPDLTAQQRSERNVLVEELKVRRARGEKDLKIFRGQIVKSRGTNEARGGARPAGRPTGGQGRSENQ